MRPSRAAWRAWIRRPTSFSVAAGVIASETDSSTTACFATAWTTLSPGNTRAGIPRIWWKNTRSRAKPRINGLCGHNSASRARKRRDISSHRSRRSRFPAGRGRRHSIRTKPTVPTTTIEALARLKPAFRPDGAITAGNAPGLNDAAAAMVLTDEACAARRLWRGGRRTRHVRPGAGASRQAGVAARWLGDWLDRAGGDQ